MVETDHITLLTTIWSRPFLSHVKYNRPHSPTHPTFTLQNVRAALADANKVLSSSAPDAEKEEARIEVEVFEGLQAALAK